MRAARLDGDGKADFRIAFTGDHRASTGVGGGVPNLYTGPGDTDGGWLL